MVMNQPTVEIIDQQLIKARQLARNRQPDAAAAVFREILSLQPGHAEALAYMGDFTLQQGDAAQAVLLLERGLSTSQDNASVHRRLATALERLRLQADAADRLPAVLSAIPEAYNTGLFLGEILEQHGDLHAAVTVYMRAIKNAQLRGFWLDRDTTAPWLHERVTHAMKISGQGRHDWLQRSVEPMLAQYGRDEMRRVLECIAMYCGDQPLNYADPRQKPTFLYVPDVPPQPTFERGLLPFADWLEHQADALRTELFAILESDEDVVPFHDYRTPEQAAHLFSGLPWQAYFFYRNGECFDSHHKRCPQTSRVLEQLPLPHIREHAPETCFSVLRPGSHILPHRGVTNARSVLHLPLIVPGQCALRLTGVDTYCWEQDRCFAFDDTYEHEAWNRSESTRVILLTDIWNPHLSEAECLALQALIEQIGNFNRATAPCPLPGAATGRPD